MLRLLYMFPTHFGVIEGLVPIATVPPTRDPAPLVDHDRRVEIDGSRVAGRNGHPCEWGVAR